MILIQRAIWICLAAIRRSHFGIAVDNVTCSVLLTSNLLRDFVSVAVIAVLQRPGKKPLTDWRRAATRGFSTHVEKICFQIEALFPDKQSKQ